MIPSFRGEIEMYAGGDTVAGYTLVRRLGEGGMGEIWEAVRQNGPLELRAALKVAFPQVLETDEGRALFEREASLCGTLRHPNIAAIVDADFDKGVILYELVDGADLRAVLSVGAGNVLDLPILTSILVQICKGLNHAHGRRVGGTPSPVIHRDLSPGNVVIDYDGNVKVVDFGIAKAIAASERSRTVKGKLSYMAPEQADGKDVDGRTDQYALGVIAYEALAGRRPNDGSHEGETLGRLLSGQHVSIQEAAPQVPSGIASIIERMLSLRPEDRFADLDAVVDALEPFSPPLSVHRDLAKLVHKARPRHTILMRDGKYLSVPVSEFNAGTNSFTAKLPAPPSGSAPADSPQLFVPTERLANVLQQPTDAPARTPSQAPPVPPPAAGRPPLVRNLATSSAGSFRHSAPILWGLAAGLLVFASAALLFRSQISPEASWAVQDDKPARARAPLSVPKLVHATHLANAPADAPAKVHAATGDKLIPQQPAPQSPTIADSPEPATIAAPTPARPRSARGVLHVGVFPQSQVWIDGKPKGRSPLVIEVRPGKHTVGAGQRAAVVEKRVRVRTGETKKIFLELRNQQATLADTAQP